MPERCLVFELNGAAYRFNVAAQALGLEWLLTEDAEFDADSDEDESDEVTDEDAELDTKAKLLYLTMPSDAALRELLKYWKKYSKGYDCPDGLTPLWRLFDYLTALRVWSIEDRLDPALARYVNRILSADPGREVTVELDLWYRSEKQRRDQSVEHVKEMLAEVGGTLLDQVDIREIKYQGLLIRVPASVARQMAEGGEGIASLDDIMTIRPQSSFQVSVEEGALTTPASRRREKKDQRAALAAVLDGYPIERHEALADRVRVVEVDVTGEQAPVSARFHGTSMLSLVLNGDLHDEDEAPLNRRIISIPVLAGNGHQEETPRGKMPIGVIYRALRAITLADPLEDPELANITVINHSICDVISPYVRRASPWAALLDHFSHHNRLLFVLSAGNIFSSVPVPGAMSASHFEDATDTEREAMLIAAMENAKGQRGLLSPAESVNSLTVGALHSDGSPAATGMHLDPYPTLRMTSLVSALGPGLNRCIKPELIASGGRYAARCTESPEGPVELHPFASVDFGHLVAAPSLTGSLSHYVRTAGTSNAAALVTRASHHIADALDDLYGQDNIDWQGLRTRTPILKVLLVHGCEWGGIGAVLDKAFLPQGQGSHSTRRSAISKFLGFGAANAERVVSGNANRATLLGDDVIKDGTRHNYVLPIPATLLNNKEVRSVTLTMAWTTPTTHTTSDPRAVVLKLCGSDGKSKYWEGVTTGAPQPSSVQAARGTIVHVRHRGDKLVKNANGKLEICVQAVAKPGFEQVEVPYALAVTIEIGQRQRTELYNEVRQSVQPRTRVRQ